MNEHSAGTVHHHFIHHQFPPKEYVVGFSRKNNYFCWLKPSFAPLCCCTKWRFPHSANHSLPKAFLASEFPTENCAHFLLQLSIFHSSTNSPIFQHSPKARSQKCVSCPIIPHQSFQLFFTRVVAYFFSINILLFPSLILIF